MPSLPHCFTFLSGFIAIDDPPASLGGSSALLTGCGKGGPWLEKVMERLSQDLRVTFLGMTGLSVRNLRHMRDLVREWPDEANGQQLVSDLPWGTGPEDLCMLVARQPCSKGF